jgi:hypothetical protein
MPVAKMEMKSETKYKLSKLLIVGMMNLPVSKHTAGSTQYATSGSDVNG